MADQLAGRKFGRIDSGRDQTATSHVSIPNNPTGEANNSPWRDSFAFPAKEDKR
jgi:predicted porin